MVKCSCKTLAVDVSNGPAKRASEQTCLGTYLFQEGGGAPAGRGRIAVIFENPASLWCVVGPQHREKAGEAGAETDESRFHRCSPSIGSTALKLA